MAAAASPDESEDAAALSGSQAGYGADAGRGEAEGGPLAVIITGEDWLDAICPFLRARDGSWRSASPVREHRCWATDPPSELPVLTQQRLCLMRAHDGCERFLHARELRSASLARDRGPGVDTPPVGVSVPRAAARRGAGLGDAIREATAAVLRLPRILLGFAAAGLGIVLAVGAMTLGGRGDGPATSTRPSAPVIEASDSPSRPDASRGPDGFRRYRVKEGDTLRTIADRFGVSVRQIRQVNDLGDPPRLEAGDVILVPDNG